MTNYWASDIAVVVCVKYEHRKGKAVWQVQHDIRVAGRVKTSTRRNVESDS